MISISYIGDNIKRIRTEKGVTQQELANKCTTIMHNGKKMSGSAIRKYESGTVTPKLEVINRIAEALDVPSYKLLRPVYYVDQLPSGETWDELMGNIDSIIFEEYMKSIENSMKQLNNKGMEKVFKYAFKLTKDGQYKKGEIPCPEQPKTPDQSENGRTEHGKDD